MKFQSITSENTKNDFLKSCKKPFNVIAFICNKYVSESDDKILSEAYKIYLVNY